MSRRAGLIGGLAGVAAAGGAGAAAIAIRRRRRVDLTELTEQPKDRSGRVVAEDGVGLYYEEVGPSDAALTVVFVHGFCLALGEFYFQRTALAERFGDRLRLVLYDQRSHGRSDRSPRADCSIDQLGRDLGSVVDSLAPTGPVLLVGHSMGGMTVMALADQRPELFAADTGRVAAVALISTSSGKMASVTLGLPAMLARLKGPVLPFLLRGARWQPRLVERGRIVGSDLAWVITRKIGFVSADVAPATVEYLTRMLASTHIEVVADFYPTLMDHDKLAALTALRELPVQIICGDHDVMTPLAHSEQIAVALPGAELVVVPDAGHMALMEQPEAVDDALIRLVETALVPARSTRRWRRG